MTPYSHALSVVVDERIRELADYRHWFRRLSPSLQSAFRPLDTEYRAELVALLRLRRKARLAYRAAEVGRTRAIDARIERVLDAGYPDTEGDPAWNGALNRW